MLFELSFYFIFTDVVFNAAQMRISSFLFLSFRNHFFVITVYKPGLSFYKLTKFGHSQNASVHRVVHRMLERILQVLLCIVVMEIRHLLRRKLANHQLVLLYVNSFCSQKNNLINFSITIFR